MRNRLLLGAIVLACPCALAVPARAQTLLQGDRLEYETTAAFGFEDFPALKRDPCSVETRLSIDVAKVDAKGMDVDIGIAVGVRAIRYQGPGFSWALEPVTPDGFIGRPLEPQEVADLGAPVLPRSLPPLAKELVRKELGFASAVALLHGRRAHARVACGPEPFVRIDAIDCPYATKEQLLLAERYLRAAVLLAFPPVPLDLSLDTPRYSAGGSTYAVTGYRDAYWPIHGRQHRIRSIVSSSAARAAFAFEAMHDTGLETLDAGPRTSEWADVHAALGIAGQRRLRVVSDLFPREEKGTKLRAIAHWHAALVNTVREGKDTGIAAPKR